MMSADALVRPLGNAPVFFGTMERQDQAHDATYTAVREALQCGYRHFDLAEHYATNGQVGRALSESEIPRDELFIVSKYDGMPVGDYAAVKARVQAMLDVVGLQRFDLILVHYPACTDKTDLTGDPAALATPSAWQFFVEHAKVSWEHMTRLRRDGLATHVGTSNFYPQHLAELSKYTGDGAPVFANEIFIDAAHPQEEFVKAMHAQGIQVLAYRPLAFVPHLALLDDLSSQLTATTATVDGIESPHQLVLGWLRGRGISPIASSLSPEHIASNFRAPILTLQAPTPCSRDGGNEQERLLSSHDPSEQLRGVLSAIAVQRDLIDMMGALDEYAAAFQQMGAAGLLSSEIKD